MLLYHVPEIQFHATIRVLLDVDLEPLIVLSAFKMSASTLVNVLLNKNLRQYLWSNSNVEQLKLYIKYDRVCSTYVLV